ncbi:MAG TPA: hypothetical protein VJK52_00535 [Candidatus Nanoarchaeia archaeon]|nr:hypothetical protein [Candidatus Nanoarchaeia archaeon]
MAALSTLGIFTFRDDVLSASRAFILPFGALGAVLFAGLIFLIVFKGFRDREIVGLSRLSTAIIAALLAWIFFSYLMDNEDMLGWGIILLILLLLFLAIRGIWRLGHRSIRRRDLRQWERIQERDSKRERRDAEEEQEEIIGEQDEKEGEKKLLADAEHLPEIITLLLALREEGNQEMLNEQKFSRICQGIVEQLHREEMALEQDFPEAEREKRFSDKDLQRVKKQTERLREEIEHDVTLQAFLARRQQASVAVWERELRMKKETEQRLEELSEGKKLREKKIAQNDADVREYLREMRNIVQAQGQQLRNTIRRTRTERMAAIEQLIRLEQEKQKNLVEVKARLVENIESRNIVSLLEKKQSALEQQLAKESEKLAEKLDEAKSTA